MRVRDRPSLRQTVEVVDPSGQRSYWTEDAPDPADAFQDLAYSSAAPGGYAALDCKLVRKIAVAYGDMAPYVTARVQNASGGIDWEGRLERAARTSGREVAASPSAVGFQAALEDDKSVRELYVDTDLTHWVQSTVSRQNALLAGGYGISIGPEVVAQGSASAILRLSQTGPWGTGVGRPVVEAWYNAAGVSIDELRASVEFTPAVSLADSNWIHQIALSSDDLGTTLNSTSVDAAGDHVADATGVRTWARVLQLYDGGGGGGQADYGSHWRLTVYGHTELPAHSGFENVYGYYASDLIDHQIRTGFPTWQRKITPTSYAITQAVYLEPTTRAEIIKDINRFHTYDWFVWEGPLFEYRPRSEPGRRWRSQVGPAQLEETGPAGDKMWRSVIVSWKDPDGSTRTVGPPGSGAQTTDVSLTNGELDIPADRVFHLPLDMASSGAAIQAGQRFLYEANQVDRSGKAIQVGYVEDADTGIVEPASHMRGGDVIAFTDASDTGFRRISNAGWDRASRTANLDLDAPAESLEAVIARLNASTAGLAI